MRFMVEGAHDRGRAADPDADQAAPAAAAAGLHRTIPRHHPARLGRLTSSTFPGLAGTGASTHGPWPATPSRVLSGRKRRFPSVGESRPRERIAPSSAAGNALIGELEVVDVGVRVVRPVGVARNHRHHVQPRGNL